MTNKTIFSAQTTNGSSSTFNAVGGLNGSAKNYSFLTVYGEFDGADLTLEFLKEGGNPTLDADWYSTGDVSITESCAYFIEISVNVPYRLTLANADASTSISSTVYNVS